MAKDDSDDGDSSDIDRAMTDYASQSKRARKLQDKHYKWAKDQERANWDVATPIIENLTKMQDSQNAWATEDRDWYTGTFKPYTQQYMTDIEGFQGKVDEFDKEVDKLKADALAYGGYANQDFMAGQAVASVAEEMEASRQKELSALEKYGINPSATRYAAMDASIRTAEAAAKAAAGTKAAQDVTATSRDMFDEALGRELEARGLDKDVLAMKKGMVDYGTTVNEQQMKEAELAGGLGKTAVDSQIGVSDLANKMRVSTTDFMDSTNEALRGWSESINQADANAVEAEKAEAEASSGIGSIVGAAVPLIGKLPFFSAKGGPVPTAASPSGGAIVDDVNAMVTSGEFIFPREAAMFYGTDRLQKMVNKVTGGTGNKTAGGNTTMTTGVEPAIPEQAGQFTTPRGSSGFSRNLFA